MLDAHDAQAATRELPRPTPALPDGWRRDGEGVLVHRDVDVALSESLLRCDDDTALCREERSLDAMLSLVRWERGRRALARLVELREQRAEAVSS